VTHDYHGSLEKHKAPRHIQVWPMFLFPFHVVVLLSFTLSRVAVGDRANWMILVIWIIYDTMTALAWSSWMALTDRMKRSKAESDPGHHPDISSRTDAVEGCRVGFDRFYSSCLRGSFAGSSWSTRFMWLRFCFMSNMGSGQD
jgi:hypothetical protein